MTVLKLGTATQGDAPADPEGGWTVRVGRDVEDGGAEGHGGTRRVVF